MTNVYAVCVGGVFLDVNVVVNCFRGHPLDGWFSFLVMDLYRVHTRACTQTRSMNAYIIHHLLLHLFLSEKRASLQALSTFL